MIGQRLFQALVTIVLLTSIALIAGCQSLPLTPQLAVSTPLATTVVEAIDEATPTPTDEMQTSPQATSAPIRITIPDLDLEIPVTPMGWESVEVNGERTTRWIVPEAAAGWALNSAGAGAVGNTVVVGHQTRGDAVFAALALDEVEVGQEILLTDETGADFTYRVIEVSAPVTLLGATPEESAQAAAYMAPTADARLTMVTGWPADTTTHRIFVVAELVAEAQ